MQGSYSCSQDHATKLYNEPADSTNNLTLYFCTIQFNRMRLPKHCSW
jgi:hypothetical protein